MTGPKGFDIVCARCHTRNSEIVSAEKLPKVGDGWRVHYSCRTCGQRS